MLQGIMDFLWQRFFGRTDCDTDGSELPEDGKAEATGNHRQETGSPQEETTDSLSNEEAKVPSKRATVLIMVAAPLDFKQVGFYWWTSFDVCQVLWPCYHGTKDKR